MANRKKVYVALTLPEILVEMLEREYEVEVYDRKGPISKELLGEKMRTVDAVVVSASIAVPRDVIESAGPCLKAIVNYGVGYNNIDVEAATERKIMVTNTPDVLTDATATFAWCLMLAAARRVGEGDRFIRSGKPWNLSPCDFWGRDITGRTLGVIGTGRIGTSFALKSRGFDMKILYHDVARSETLEKLGANLVSKEELLRESDFVSLHVPYIPATHHLIGARAFEIMKPTAILVNCARGPVVDEKALVAALKTGQIWGAGLDVYENEPVVSPELLEMENVVMAPHIASASPDSREGMARLAAENCIAALTGKRPGALVNPEVLG